jgi:hypothetical protein
MRDFFWRILGFFGGLIAGIFATAAFVYWHYLSETPQNPGIGAQSMMIVVFFVPMGVIGGMAIAELHIGRKD